MKRIKISLLALAAITGISSAFTSKKASKTAFTYGILGITVGGNGYIIETFSQYGVCVSAPFTCFITSSLILVSPVATSSINDYQKHDGAYFKITY